MTMKGADAVLKALEQEGVEVVFGIPGGASMPIYDPLVDRSPIRHVLCRHEQGAGHAAEGYAWATGKVGVCMATSGPGATNLVTPLTDAKMDSVPIVAITGQVPTPVVGNDAFQEADITGITMPVTKHNFLVKDPADIVATVREAFHIASTGRPGPVLIDLPKDVLQADVEYVWPEKISLPGYRPTTKGNNRQVTEAVKLIMAAKRPVLYVGGGVIKANATDELRQLAELGTLPVVTTLMARGAFPDSHELCLGMPGMHGVYTAVTAMQRADLLVALGARFDDRVTGKLSAFAPDAKIVHVDIDPAEIGKNVAVEVPIVGDAKRVLAALLPMVAEVDPATRADYLAELAGWRRESEGSSWHGSGAWRDGLLSADYVVQRIGELTDHAATYVADVGQNQMWLARYVGFRRPNTHVSSGGLGTMGFSVPAAMGAALGAPERETWAITGDGGFQMTFQELMTLVADHIPVKIALLDNKKLGMIRQWQEIIYAGNYHSAHLPGPDFAKLADAFGIPAFRARTPGEVDDAIRSAQAVDGAALVWFEIAEEQNVFPMMPAGKGLSDLIETWEGADE
jgi:acetolactate synthase I/II/III large subunit